MKLITYKEAAELTGMAFVTIRKAADSGRLKKHIRYGARLVDEDEVRELFRGRAGKKGRKGASDNEIGECQ